jgi:hypothetical protein
VEITPGGVIDELFWCLGLPTILVLEYNIIILPAKETWKEQFKLAIK